MRRITLQQIAELPDKERRQFKAWINWYLGSLWGKMGMEQKQRERNSRK